MDSTRYSLWTVLDDKLYFAATANNANDGNVGNELDARSRKVDL